MRTFQRYVEFFNAGAFEGEGPYFGWLSNRLPSYPETLNLKTSVHLRTGRQRPEIELAPTNHPLAIHQREGIELATLLNLLADQLHA